MKKLVASLIIAAAASSAVAGPYNHGHYHGHGSGSIAPLIIGGIIGYGLSQANQAPVVVQQQPIYVPQPAPVVIQQQPANRTPIYRQVQRYNVDCNCYTIQYEQIGWQ